MSRENSEIYVCKELMKLLSAQTSYPPHVMLLSRIEDKNTELTQMGAKTLDELSFNRKKQVLQLKSAPGYTVR